MALLEAAVAELREALQREREDRRAELGRVERSVADMVAPRASFEVALGATPEEGDGSLAGEAVAELRADVPQLGAAALEESVGASRSLRRLPEGPERARGSADLANFDRMRPSTSLPALVLPYCQRRETRVLSGELASAKERHVSDASSPRTLSDCGSDSGASDAMPDSARTLCRSVSAGQAAMLDDRESRMTTANADRESTISSVCERVADLEPRMAAAKAWQPRGLAAPAGMPAAQQAMPTLLICRSSASVPSLMGSLPDGAKRSLQLPLGVPRGAVFARDGMSVAVAPRGMPVAVSPRPAASPRPAFAAELPAPMLVAPVVAQPPTQALATGLVIRQRSFCLQTMRRSL